MAVGKYLSLKEARKTKKLDRFAEEHPTKGSKKVFDSDSRSATCISPHDGCLCEELREIARPVRESREH